MALHAYTFQKLQQAAAHATGKATPDTGSSYADVVNDAVLYLASMKAWQWRKTALSLNLTSGQSYVALPADFGELMSLAGTAGTTLPRIHWSTLDAIASMRQLTGVSGQELYVALSYAPQASVTAAPAPRLEIFPTPTAAATAAITGFYLRIPPAMSANSDVPDVPPAFLPALKALCRAMAVSNEDQQEGADWSLFNRLVQTLAARDTMAQPHGFRVVGTVEMTGNNDLQMNDVRFFPASSAGVS